MMMNLWLFWPFQYSTFVILERNGAFNTHTKKWIWRHPLTWNATWMAYYWTIPKMTCHLFSIIVKNITSILIWHISVKSNLSIQSWNTLLPNRWMHIMLELFFRILVNFDRTHETICTIRCKDVLNCFFVVSTPSFSIKFSCCNFTHDNVHPWHLTSWTMMGGGGNLIKPPEFFCGHVKFLEVNGGISVYGGQSRIIIKRGLVITSNTLQK